jgi:hypothetical protein
VLILAARSLQLVAGTRDEVTLSFIICTTLLWLLEYTLHSLEHNGSNIASESIIFSKHYASKRVKSAAMNFQMFRHANSRVHSYCSFSSWDTYMSTGHISSDHCQHFRSIRDQFSTKDKVYTVQWVV